MTAAITHIELKGLRCWGELSWQPDSGVNLLTGNNGVGKTSLMNAVVGQHPIKAGKILWEH